LAGLRKDVHHCSVGALSLAPNTVGAANAGETFVTLPPPVRKVSTIRPMSASVGGGSERQRAMCCLIVFEPIQNGCMSAVGFGLASFMFDLTRTRGLSYTIRACAGNWFFAADGVRITAGGESSQTRYKLHCIHYTRALNYR
jgi:hypothetical protein